MARKICRARAVLGARALRAWTPPIGRSMQPFMLGPGKRFPESNQFIGREEAFAGVLCIRLHFPDRIRVGRAQSPSLRESEEAAYECQRPIRGVGRVAEREMHSFDIGYLDRSYLHLPDSRQDDPVEHPSVFKGGGRLAMGANRFEELGRKLCHGGRAPFCLGFSSPTAATLTGILAGCNISGQLERLTARLLDRESPELTDRDLPLRPAAPPRGPALEDEHAPPARMDAHTESPDLGVPQELLPILRCRGLEDPLRQLSSRHEYLCGVEARGSSLNPEPLRNHAGGI